MSSIYAQSIDDLLGDRTKRYFGEGYRSVVHRISDPQIYEANGTTFYSFHGYVEVANIWSQKGHVDQTPHLSTIDVLELTTLCLATITERYWDKSRCHIAPAGTLTIVAGKSPVDKLEDVSIAGVLHLENGGQGLAELELGIANMLVRVPLAIGGERAPPRLDGLNQLSAVTEIVIQTGKSEPAGPSASALAAPVESNADEVWGLAVSFAAVLQLGQALLYDLDSVDRAQTNTLWMKRTSIDFGKSTSRFEGARPMRVTLENVRKYEKQDGAWRRADIIGHIADRTIRCGVTHKLP